MSEWSNTTRDATKGERIRLPCGRCATNTFHVVQSSLDVEGLTDGFINYWDHYQIVQCQGCDEYSFRKLERNSEEFHEDPETGEKILDEHVALFPPRIAGRPPLANSFAIPSKIRAIYDETHKALLGKQPILTGVGLRSLIEAVCREKNALGNNLEKRIDSLVEIGVLTKDGSEIFHSLRHLGNAAAHEAEAYPEHDLSTAFDVVEHLLRTVYIIPWKAKRLNRRH